jgi:3-deoxy-D-manno-octulosonate 8-phosphate phosphatase (KDO 8-P phosphatase)
MPETANPAGVLDTPSLTDLLAGVKLLLMDVDGVLTDGRIYFLPDGKGGLTETKGFDSQDGIALQWLKWHGIATGVISGRDSDATRERARQCSMKYCYQGHIEKIPIIEEILTDAGITANEIAFIGDDFTDVVVMRRVGIGIATANAKDEVKHVAHYVTTAPGGSGAVREVAELILKSKGLWDGILRKYELLV